MIRDAAPLHDIGKVGMSRRILLKPGKLTPAEWMHMMRHVEIGARILSSARHPSSVSPAISPAPTTSGGTGTVTSPASPARTFPWPVGSPHWRTCGTRSPTSVHTSLPGTRDRALAEIQGEAGRHFDPRVVEAFATIDWRELNLILASELAARAA